MNQLFKFQRPAGVEFRDVLDLTTALGEEVVAIYENSFPEAERESHENMAAHLRNGDPETEVTRLRALVEQGQVIGFTYFASYKSYYLGFLKFIAVRADIRSKGYGKILLQDALQQIRADGRRATGWPYLGLVFEVERPEAAENDAERQIRVRRIQFYERNGAKLLTGIDYIAPPIAPGQPSLPFHLMVLKAVPKYGMQRWLGSNAVTALMVEGYGEDPDSWFIHHALDVRQRARGTAASSTQR